MSDDSASCWYEALEPGVREVVRALRNNGINTTCSCEHEMTIQAETSDPTQELRTIYTVLHELGYTRWRAEVVWDIDNETHCSSRILTLHLLPD